MKFRLPGKAEEWSYEQYESQISGLAANLKNGTNVSPSLLHIVNLDAPYSLLKQYDIKSLVAKHSDKPETTHLVKSCRNKLKAMKKLEAEKREEERQRYEKQKADEFGLDLSDENEQEEPCSSSQIEKKKKDKKNKKRHLDETTDESNDKKAKKEENHSPKKKELKIKFVDMFGEEEALKLEAKRRKERKRAQKEIAKQVFDDFEKIEEEKPNPTFKTPQRGVDMRLNQSGRNLLPVSTSVAPKPAPQKFNEEAMFKPRKDVRKVFAGRRKTKITNVKPLLDLCQSTIIQNPIYLMRCIGAVRFELVEPALKLLSPEQLLHFAMLNPVLHSDLDSMFQNMVTRHFPTQSFLPTKFEFWHEYYADLVQNKKMVERVKLEKLTEKINDRQKANDTGRRTQLISEAHTPRNIRQRQANWGLSHSMKPTPSAQELSQARKAVGNGNKNKLAAMPSAVVNKTSRVGASSGQKPPANSKTGFLMKKTLKMLGIKKKH